MKFSRFRGQDIWKMAVKLGVVIIALVVVVGVGLYFGGKYAAPKVTSFVEGVKENLAQREKEKEEEEKLAAMQEDASSGVEDSERSGEDGSGGDGADSDGTEGAEGEDSEGEGQDASESGEEPTEEETPQSRVLDDTIHSYQYLVEDCSWPEAVERCRERGGYLAVINSQEEYDYIVQQIEASQLGKIIFFLGATRGEGEEYHWVDENGEAVGEPLNGDSKWMQNEPSFQDGEVQEDVVSMFYFDEEGRWVWNDIPSNLLEHFSNYSGKIGYVCEMDE